MMQVLLWIWCSSPQIVPALCASTMGLDVARRLQGVALGSDHRLCVVSTHLNCRTTHAVPRGIPHLRGWSSTLLRAHVDLCQWSSDVCSRLDGIVPCAVASREVVVDELYQKFLAILSWHAPRQRCSPRRSQPSLWTPECYATCVARNGAWRDYQRVHTLEALTRFRVARTTFHRTVRSAQRSFWSHWQERVARLSRTHPRVAASTIRRTFRSTAASRGDPSAQVKFPSDPGCALSQHEILDGWRTHFSSVSSRGSTFDDAFFQSISARFDAVVSSPTSPGLFDASFSSSELRHALTQCVDSAVGLDGLPYSLFKANFPWWQEAILSFLNLTLAWGVVPSLWKHSIVVPVFKRGDPSDPQLSAHLPCFLFLQVARAFGALTYFSSHLPST